MPFIEESKYNIMLADLENAKSNQEEIEDQLEEIEHNYTSYRKNTKIALVLLGVLLLTSLAAVFYFYNQKKTSISESEIINIKKSEALRVIDSIERATARAQRSKKEITENTSESIDATSIQDEITNATANTTIYTVQIGVFYQKRYPFISKAYTLGMSMPANSDFKYSIGIFETEKEAKKLRNELRKLGFDDVFVASYKNGKRLKIHD